MYFIVEGLAYIELEKEGTIIKEIPITAGMFFGEMAIMDQEPGIRNASVKAAKDCTLAVLRREDFLFVL